MASFLLRGFGDSIYSRGWPFLSRNASHIDHSLGFLHPNKILFDKGILYSTEDAPKWNKDSRNSLNFSSRRLNKWNRDNNSPSRYSADSQHQPKWNRDSNHSSMYSSDQQHKPRWNKDNNRSSKYSSDPPQKPDWNSDESLSKYASDEQQKPRWNRDVSFSKYESGEQQKPRWNKDNNRSSKYSSDPPQKPDWNSDESLSKYASDEQQKPRWNRDVSFSKYESDEQQKPRWNKGNNSSSNYSSDPLQKPNFNRDNKPSNSSNTKHKSKFNRVSNKSSDYSSDPEPAPEWYRENISINYSSDLPSSSTNEEDQEPDSDLIYVDDRENFGLISRTNQMFTEKYEHDEDDKKEQEFLEKRPLRLQQLSTKKYSDLIKYHIEHKRIKEALDVLEVRMLKEDRVKPEAYIYNLAIGACAEVGYTKKAFMLYNDMKKRGLKVSGGIYTSLFSACARSPWKEDGLLRANHLRNLMLEKNIEPNLTNYNAMIKVYGRCGDLQTAFEIVDEMCSKSIKIRVHTFNFLLQSCISDRKAGFRHALLTWRKMLNDKQRPNIYTFNLMLRCIKDCGIGDRESEQKMISEILSTNPIMLPKYSHIEEAFPLLESGQQSATKIQTVLHQDLVQLEGRVDAEENLSIPINAIYDNPLPNLLSRNPTLNGVLAIGEIKTMEDRFMLTGGVEGFFTEMVASNVTPDIKTITQMLSVQPSTLESENKLLDVLKLQQIKTDINFYNVLIKKRCYRFDYESAKAVRQLIEEENRARKKKRFWEFKPLVTPDLITYGVLALCCDSKDAARELMLEMQTNKLRINSEILGSMLKYAALKLDIEYVLFIMETTKSENIPVNDTFILHLKKLKHRCQRTLQGEDTDLKVLETCKKLYDLSGEWIKEMETLKEVEPEHPWAQFRVNQPETLQPSDDGPKRRMYKKPRRKIPKYQVTG